MLKSNCVKFVEQMWSFAFANIYKRIHYYNYITAK